MNKRSLRVVFASALALALGIGALFTYPSIDSFAVGLAAPDASIVIPEKLASATVVIPGSDVEMTVTNILPTAKLAGSMPDDDSPSLQLIAIGSTAITFGKDVEALAFGEDFGVGEDGSLEWYGAGNDSPVLTPAGQAINLAPTGGQVRAIEIMGGKSYNENAEGTIFDDGVTHTHNVQYNFTYSVRVICVPDNEVLIRNYMEMAQRDYTGAISFYDTEYDFYSALKGGEAAPDVPSEWAAEQVNAAIAAGLVPAPMQSKYTQAATRVEFAALSVALYESLKGEITDRKTFADTTDANAEKAAAIGVTAGANVDGTMFMPDEALTREQAATMLNRLAAALDSPLTGHGQGAGFDDGAAISDWTVGAVNQVQASGIMQGVGENRFDPQGAYTREQSVITIMRLRDITD